MRTILFLICIFASYFMQAIEVTYKNNSMYVNGEPYYMKGICYHPVPKGKIKRDFSTLVIITPGAGLTLNFFLKWSPIKCRAIIIPKIIIRKIIIIDLSFVDVFIFF